jgi:hypothetical protein
VKFSQEVPTITLDLSEEVSLQFPDASLIAGIVTTGCGKIMIKIDQKEPFVIDSKSQNPLTQFLTRTRGSSCVTEELVREGAGYLTTKREKAENDRKLERNLLLLERSMRNSLVFSPKK